MNVFEYEYESRDKEGKKQRVALSMILYDSGVSGYTIGGFTYEEENPFFFR